MAHGRMYYPADVPGFLALVDSKPTGLLMYEIVGTECEIVFIDSGTRSTGIGSALLDAVKEAARDARCTRLWLVTTNDNVDALRFYQRRGFMLVALRPNALEAARRLSPRYRWLALSDFHSGMSWNSKWT
jgi:ribosomal protein S18 acetylase RimI-like enzyme